MINETYVLMAIPFILIALAAYIAMFWVFPAKCLYEDDWDWLQTLLEKVNITYTNNYPLCCLFQAIAKGLTFHLILAAIVGFVIWILLGFQYMATHDLFPK